MSIRLQADPQALMSASAKMGDLAAQFQAAYKALESAADTAYGAWKGGDAEAFHSRVLALDDDFMRIYQLLQGASQDLQESSKLYAQTQDSAQSRASSLATSI